MWKITNICVVGSLYDFRQRKNENTPYHNHAKKSIRNMVFLIFGHIDDFSKLHSTVQHSCMLHFFKKSSSFAFNQYSLGARNLGFRYCTTKQSPKYFPFYCMKRGRLLLRLLFKVFWRVKEV